MPWMIGVDEAGYGPNLGPFVMSMAAVHVPADLAASCLWKLLAKAVRRVADEDDGRLAVDDSKRVYSTAIGLGLLEQSLLPFQWSSRGDSVPVSTYWNRCCLRPLAELQSELWHDAEAELPLHSAPGNVRSARQRLLAACSAVKIRPTRVFSVVVFPEQFNAMIRRHENKAAIPASALEQLLTHIPEPEDDATTRICVDKLGGRHYYHELAQTCFPDAIVMTRMESARESRYQVIGRGHNCQISFQPEADGHCFPVALASMASKYLREVLMIQFNRFWQKHLPELKPTAGYPGDSRRFYDDIRSVRQGLGIADERLWRVR